MGVPEAFMRSSVWWGSVALATTLFAVGLVLSICIHSQHHVTSLVPQRLFAEDAASSADFNEEPTLMTPRKYILAGDDAWMDSKTFKHVKNTVTAADDNGDGRLSRSEAAESGIASDGSFDKVDADGDGHLDINEVAK